MNRKIYLAFSFVLLFLWMWLIYYFSNQNAEVSSGQSGRLLGVINGFLRGSLNIEITENLIRKAAHFFIYFVLGLLAYNSIGRLQSVSFLAVLAFCVLYAASDEFHQTFISGRAGRIGDIFIDTCGSLLGMILYLMILKKGSKEQ